MTNPYFSIILPTYNRGNMICRAIDSCFNQSFDDFEILIIDDGSTDNTVDIVKKYSDERLILIEHPTNQGVCPARNSGIRAARGKWLLMLDSDFEFLPGSLIVLAERTRSATEEIGNVASSCKWDTGIVTPSPSVPDKPLDFEAYLKWSDTLTIPEWFNCIRREVFETISYPAGRAYEGSFHLDLLSRWKMHVSREPSIIFYTDADNRITAAPPKQLMNRLLRDAEDGAIDSEKIVLRHGDALRKWAPQLFRDRLNITATHFYLAGHRKAGFKYSVKAIRNGFFRQSIWATMFLGLLGAKTLAWIKSYR